MTDAVLLAPLALAVSLAVAGVAKLRDPVGSAIAFEDLGVPAALSGPRAVLALPWVEIVLAVGLVALPAPWTLVAAVPATLLLVVYVGLVLRVLRAGEEVSCQCFGGIGDGAVDSRALARNVLLLLAGLLGVVDAASGGSVVGRVPDLGGEGWAWLVGGVLLALLAALVVGSSRATAEERAGIPYLTVHTEDGESTSLPELASLRPVLLVLLSTSCSHCERVSAQVADWPAMLPEVAVHVVGAGADADPRWPAVLRDPEEQIARVLGMGRPSAVLLGADALVAGGPVTGAGDVLRLASDVRARLDEA
ncbi:hypothetical protein GCM10011519_26950 [Marmoricola endophyticus]|uniref:Methylamine utilisation protein MauE domain-containing protein n=1 Tax=Marmoricola endophyticus TaxID=2040280 RepID=A0A917BNF2_9ACTN|nr:MauE/DoxX family redox-associated membrane protein [Marmoricola endophyticus]GGF51562.1 hypothetical protein GCM10011519_26950 [Marmoricola endophyticus]